MQHTIHLSATDKTRLVQLRRRTGIDTWAVACRWALARSLAAPRSPQILPPAGGGPSIDWETLGGRYAPIYWALAVERGRRDGIDVADAAQVVALLRAHVQRGLSLLSGVRSLPDLLREAAL
jgi:DNA sulfur modification protein DndE